MVTEARQERSLGATRRFWGAALWMACLQFFMGEAIAALAWRGAYSYRLNFISDLGAAGSSPLHAVMNASFVLQGVLIVGGAVLLWPFISGGAMVRIALGLIAASGFGVLLVGLAPEDAFPRLHYLGASEILLFCNGGAALLGVGLMRATPAAGLLSLSAGLLGLAGVAALVGGADFGLGAGGVERVAAYPFPFWIAGMGAWLLAGGQPAARTSLSGATRQ